MRVIAGSLKGRRLNSPKWPGLRPTSDKLRETLFNVLGGLVQGARVLDAYAGTGAVGIEALSRGAASVTFIDADRRAEALIEENLTRCGLDRQTSGCVIIRAPVARGLASLTSGPSRAPFDVVFFDPPYDAAAEAELVLAGAILAPGGVVIVEHATRRQPPERAGRLVRTRQIVSGDSTLSFYVSGE